MMPVPWKLWEGQVVDLCLPLRRYLGGSDRGAVFLTQYGDPDLRQAVIKLVIVGPQDNELLLQWDRSALLSHRHVLRIMRTGRWQINQMMLHYVVTEYAEENLADVLAERSLTPAEAREMLTPLLDALSYIHREGMVHGHLKPSNIMAVGDQLKLSVDGISRVADAAAASPTPGPYDPPEFQDRGPSPVGDVWSFGVTLVESLTQQLPVLRDPRSEPLLPDTLPNEFLPLVRACLRPDPRRRATLEDILPLLRSSKVPAAAVAAAPIVVESPAERKKWLNLALVSAAALGLAAILAVPRLLNSHGPGANSPELTVASAAAREAVKPEPPPAAPSAPQVSNPSPMPSAEPPAPSPSPVASALPAPAPAAPVSRPPAGNIENTPAAALHQVMPEVPASARRTIRGKVRVTIVADVDAEGHVANTRIDSENSKYFANLALHAARQWSFEPGASRGPWLLKFEFTAGGTTVHPTHAGH